MTQRDCLIPAGMALLLFVLAALPVGATVTAATDLTIGGYTQARLEVGDGIDSSFFTPRMYLFGNAQTGTDTSVAFQLKGVNKFGVQKAYVQQVNGAYTYRMGFDSVPFGLESPMADWQLPTLERSRIVSDNVYDDWGFDNGLFISKAADKNGVAANLALTNGKGVNRSGLPYNGDDNNGKCLTARVTKTAKTKTCGISYQLDDGGSWSMLGLDYQGKTGDLGIIAEAVKDLNSDYPDNQGVYVTVIDNKAGLKTKPYARIDWVDYDDTSTQFTLGASKAVNPMTKQTVEIQFQDENDEADTVAASGGCGSFGTWKATFQVQGKF
jgi:hypothetical protein